MPDRSYIPPNPVQLRRRDHLKAHPDRAVLSLVSVAIGVLLAVSVLSEGFVPSRSVDSLPAATTLAISLLMTAGGVATCWGSLTLYGDLSRIWRTMRTGLFALWVGWLSYALTVLAVYPTSIIPWLSSLGLAVVFIIHWWATGREEHVLRRLGRLIHHGGK